jgi:hypothetical protein
VEQQPKTKRAAKEKRREYYHARRIWGSLNVSSEGDAG